MLDASQFHRETNAAVRDRKRDGIRNRVSEGPLRYSPEEVQPVLQLAQIAKDSQDALRMLETLFRLGAPLCGLFLGGVRKIVGQLVSSPGIAR